MPRRHATANKQPEEPRRHSTLHDDSSCAPLNTSSSSPALLTFSLFLTVLDDADVTPNVLVNPHDVYDDMRSASLILLLTLSLTAQASWFGGDSSSSSASAQASAWSSEQYAKMQQVFHGLKADAFDTWDESRLREFLLEQGVVEPKGTREQLRVLAKQHYTSFTNVASSYSSTATSLAGDASASAASLTSKAGKSATSLASKASNSASTAVYGDSAHQASKSISSTYAQATNDISRKLDDTKDYVYST